MIGKLLGKFSRPKTLTTNAELHLYSEDIARSTKQRDAALQRLVLQPTDENWARLAVIEGELDIMHEVYTRLLRQMSREEKGNE